MEEHYLTTAKISAFVQHLREEERESGTIEKYLRSIHAFVAWLENRPVTKETAAGWKEYCVHKAISRVRSIPCSPH